MADVTRADLDRVHADLHGHIEQMQRELMAAIEQLTADVRQQNGRIGKNEQAIAVQTAIVQRVEKQTDNQWKALRGRQEENGYSSDVAARVAELPWKIVVLLATVLLGLVEIGKLLVPELLRRL